MYMYMYMTEFTGDAFLSLLKCLMNFIDRKFYIKPWVMYCYIKINDQID